MHRPPFFVLRGRLHRTSAERHDEARAPRDLVDFSDQIPVGARHGEPNTRVADRLAGYLGRTPDDDLRRVLLVAVESADTLVQLAFRTDPEGDEAIIHETRELLRAHLARVLD